jgi:hypothetical protein
MRDDYSLKTIIKIRLQIAPYFTLCEKTPVRLAFELWGCGLAQFTRSAFGRESIAAVSHQTAGIAKANISPFRCQKPYQNTVLWIITS